MSARREGSAVVAVLERAWAEIRDVNPRVPEIVAITGAGSNRPGAGLRLGHFAAERWADGPRCLGELFVAGEGFERGAEDVLVTLLHEAAHAIAHAEQIRDTSRQGRYHNTRFRALAEQLGLVAEHHPVHGWSTTRLAAGTATLYPRALGELASLTELVHREHEHPVQQPTGPRGLLACRCRCGRRIRVAAGTLRSGAITCELCDSPFTAVTRATNSAS